MIGVDRKKFHHGASFLRLYCGYWEFAKVREDNFGDLQMVSPRGGWISYVDTDECKKLSEDWLEGKNLFRIPVITSREYRENDA